MTCKISQWAQKAYIYILSTKHCYSNSCSKQSSTGVDVNNGMVMFRLLRNTEILSDSLLDKSTMATTMKNIEEANFVRSETSFEHLIKCYDCFQSIVFHVKIVRLRHDAVEQNRFLALSKQPDFMNTERAELAT
ncbi:ArsR-like helix-turn-helix domain-containing protein [Dioscorea alata]|uniref:ArsR-like helix-turn-helix domain-containing protein n=1 Tax=Dioscorea alata TaxID=55571 RepID=A0ACB7V8X9_DIOAL|nr:ArsR-like helix-turn-helix domain-containing protein [Dioscorea alata]